MATGDKAALQARCPYVHHRAARSGSGSGSGFIAVESCGSGALGPRAATCARTRAERAWGPAVAGREQEAFTGQCGRSANVAGP